MCLFSISLCEVKDGNFENVLFQYNFEGRYDLVKFVKIVGSSGLYLHLRIGPYVCAEWNFGYCLLTTTGVSCFCPLFSFLYLFFFSWILVRGFPVWLRDVPGIEFRTDNEPFKVHFLLLLLYFLMSVLALLYNHIFLFDVL